MVYRRYSLIVLLLFTAGFTHAQVLTFQQADSTSAALYLAGRWKPLIDFGEKAINAGVDFPMLRQRLGYAQFMTGHFSAALREYRQVLKNDSYNPTARYFSVLSEKYLGRFQAAAYQSSFLDSATRNSEGITRFGLVEAGLETGLKTANSNTRGGTFYIRPFVSNRLGYRVQLDQSVIYVDQAISIPSSTGAVATPTGRSTATIDDSQIEYYAKLSYTLNSQFLVMGAYHFSSTKYGTAGYYNHVGLFGLKYLHPYFDLELDINRSFIIDKNSTQSNATLRVYPLGNLNLYTASRVAYQAQEGVKKTVFSQSLGFKVFNNFWLEGNATFGTLDNYLDNDALYMYNSIDQTTLKWGATGFYRLNNHTYFHLNYTFERKLEASQNTTYNQNSITGGITWKF